MFDIDLMDYYRPLSEASEGYIFTGICLSNSGGEGGVDQGPGHNTSLPPPRDQVDNTPLPPTGHGHNTPQDQWTTPPSPHRTWSQHPPPPSPRTRWTTPPGTWSQHPLSPPPAGHGHNTPSPLGPGGQHPIPLGHGHNERG